MLWEGGGVFPLTVPLLEDACGHQGRNATCVLTVTFHTPTAGNHIGDDIRSLAFLLNSATFVSTMSQSANRVKVKRRLNQIGVQNGHYTNQANASAWKLPTSRHTD